MEGEVPKRSQGPRLWLKPTERGREAVWIIKDGGRRISTGCGVDDADGAERALARHLATKHAKRAAEARNRAVTDTPIADIIWTYWQAREAEVARPAELRTRLRFLVKWWGDRKVDEISPDLCRRYAEHRGSPASARRELEDLRAAVHHAAKHRIITAVVPVTLPVRGVARERWLTRSEAARLIWAAWRYRETNRGSPGRYTRRHIARFILVALYTGSRAGAICGASLSQEQGRGWVDLDGGTFYRAADMERATTKRKPTIRLPAPLLAHLRRWAAAGERRKRPMKHIVEWNGRPVERINQAFKRVVKDAGLSPDVTPHVMRHTAVTWALQRGASQFDVAGYFGLTPTTINRVYGHHSPDHQASVHATFARGRK